jgi:hypothetical protein
MFAGIHSVTASLPAQSLLPDERSFFFRRKQNGRDETTRQESPHVCDADEVESLIHGLNSTQLQSLI